jgi:hypothetical protein
MATSPTVNDVILGQLAQLGLAGNGAVHRNLPPAELIARDRPMFDGLLSDLERRGVRISFETLPAAKVP